MTDKTADPFNRFDSHNAITPADKEMHRDKSHRHWAHRNETGWQKFEFNQPYAKGLTRLKNDVLADTNFDPATLWQWGTMQAMALIKMLKKAEARFGEEGQRLMLESLQSVGYDIGRQVTADTTIPPDMPTHEWMSYYATVINRIVYASLESPRIVDDSRVDFHIDWCPHQDHYGAFDCRVQRYFVQGMLDAAFEFAREQGRNEETSWDVAFRSTIPNGAPTCFFEIKKGSPEQKRRWGRYTDALEKKALRLAGHEENKEEARMVKKNVRKTETE